MKDTLKNEVLAIGRKYSKADIDAKNNLLKKNIEKLPEFKNAKTVCFYISLENEAETHGMIKDSLKNKKKVIIPYVDNQEIVLHELLDFSELEKGRLGILAPKKQFIRKFDSKNIDIIIMPGLMFDKKGHRIGFGESHYDKALSKTKAKKIAIAYDFQIVDYMPSVVHDIKADIIVTDTKTFKTANA
ncbi:MAG: 5-formyltetrahydrofolate cyclo-ligase [archaeon]